MKTVKQPAEILGEKRIVQTHLVSGLLYQFFRWHDTGSGEHVTDRITGRQIRQQKCHKADTDQHDHDLHDPSKNLFLIQNACSFLSQWDIRRKISCAEIPPP